MIETTTDFTSILASTPDFARIVRSYRSATSELEKIYTALVEPALAALTSDSPPALIFDRTGGKMPLYEQAVEMVNYAYSSRYVTGKRLLHFNDPEKDAELLVIRLDTEYPVIFATMRIAWGKSIDVFDLFDIPSEVIAAHAGPPGNVGRFSLNPIFDAILASRDQLDPAHIQQCEFIRTELFQLIVAYAFKCLRERGISTVWGITHTALRSWFTKSGVRFLNVEGVRKVDNESVRKVKTLYPGYWDKSPEVFIIEEAEIS